MSRTVTTRRARRATYLMTGVLAFGTLGAPMMAVAEPSSSSACAGVTGAVSAGEATVLAASCDREVEVVAERTAWDTVFATPEGHTRVETSAVAVRTDVNGGWQGIDTSVVEGAGRLGVVAPAVEMSFSDGSAGEPLARITRDGHELVFDAPFALTPAVVEGSQVTYPGVFEGVDLVVSMHEDGTGFSEVLRVESPQAAANPALASLSFPVQTTEGLSVVSDEGGFVARDGAGEEVFTSPTPLMWDSAADTTSTPDGVALGALAAPLSPFAPQSLRTGASSSGASLFALPATDAGVEPESGVGTGDPVLAPREGDEIAAMPADVSAEAVTITPDAQMIADPETVWPIYIDPSVSGSRNEWTMIQSGWPTSTGGYMFNGDQGVGLCDPAATSECSRRNVQRLVWEFGGVGSVGAADNADVISAVFSVVGTHSWSCTATSIRAYRVSEISGGTTWSNHAYNWGPLQQERFLAHKPSCAGQPVRWVEFDATEGARAVADYNASTLTLGLASNDESTMGGWKRYRNDALLSITYNRPPNAPSSQWTSNPDSSCVSAPHHSYLRSTTPTFHAVNSDPDGDLVMGNFNVFRYSDNALLWAHPLTAPQASGSAHSVTVPAGVLQDGQSYRWAASGMDSPYNRWGPGVFCDFTVDTTPPPLPEVLIATGGTATYPENQISGGIGQMGRFTLGSNGAPDVVSYKYSFNSDSMNQTTGVGNWNAADISFTPDGVGSQRLLVQAVDRAGNTSPVRTYRFSVNFLGTSGSWRMDEGAGAVAADSSGGGRVLGLSPSVQWGGGPLADFAGEASDRALVFDAASDTAHTTGPVVNTSGSYTVMAFVKAKDLAGIGVAVSQDGQSYGAFKLGRLGSPYCTGGVATCWGFWASQDESGAHPAIASGSAAVEPESWVHLTGVRDAVAGTVSLYVCELGTPEAPKSGEPVRAATTHLGPVTWSSGGPLQVGRGLVAGAHGENWSGAIDDVRVYDSIVSIDEIRRACQKTG
ncbi:LamG-like jellyroll fold domain-containing protein [Oerskovia sp. KBS0722]|uniref:LamG-like jellyroll fold domain-containing protein n=1 Tax=Oerskovia sp. KBS0722 TaxID=1179673 RepID=UPI00143DFD8B|nr:LamG-like jellyroll fold domain-containing protein [Oerskovia sp. KBS0722]